MFLFKILIQALSMTQVYLYLFSKMLKTVFFLNSQTFKDMFEPFLCFDNLCTSKPDHIKYL